MDFIENNIFVNFDEYDNDLPFAGNLKDTFYKIEEIIDANRCEKNKLSVLKNIADVVDCLIDVGNVQERIVLDTAQLYVLIKHTGIDEEKIKSYFGNHVIDGAKLMLKNFNDIAINLRNIFENEKYLYLSKIKIADIIVELKAYQSYEEMEANIILEKFNHLSHKQLISKLSEIIV